MAVRIGFIGTGVIARHHALALAKVKGAEIAALCDKTPGKAQAFAKAHGLARAEVFASHRKMLARTKLDAVYVLLPPYAHGPERDVIAAGLPFLVEKPQHLDLRKAEAVRDAAAKKNLMTCVAYMTRYRKSVQRVRELLARVPQPTLCYGGWIGGCPSLPWWINKKFSGGQHLEQTTHTFDLVRYLFGEVDTIYASFSKGAIKREGYSIEDASSVNLTFRNGAIGNIMSSCALTTKGGGVSLSLFTNRFVAHFRDWAMGVEIHTGTREKPKVEEVKGEENIFEIEDQAFVRAVRSNRQDMVLSTYADGLESLRLSILASESMRTGKPVKVTKT